MFAVEQVDGAHRYPDAVTVTEGDRLGRADAYFAAIGAGVRPGRDQA